MNSKEHIEELSYIVFILGYDLLHDTCEKKKDNECDVVYEGLYDIAKDFTQSKEYSTDMSLYDALVEYLTRLELI